MEHKKECIICGKEFLDTSYKKNRTVCSPECKRERYYRWRNARKIDDECPYNTYVQCLSVRNCSACGWNPDVEKERKEALT